MAEVEALPELAKLLELPEEEDPKLLEPEETKFEEPPPKLELPDEKLLPDPMGLP